MTFPSVPPSGPSKTPCVAASLGDPRALSLAFSRDAHFFRESCFAAGLSSRVFPFKIRFTTAGSRPLDPFLSPFPFPLVSLSQRFACPFHSYRPHATSLQPQQPEPHRDISSRPFHDHSRSFAHHQKHHRHLAFKGVLVCIPVQSHY
jgi:hypothetical protein